MNGKLKNPNKRGTKLSFPLCIVRNIKKVRRASKNMGGRWEGREKRGQKGSDRVLIFEKLHQRRSREPTWS